MLSLVTRDWWVYTLRGIAAILFGILAFAWPGPTLAALVLLFGAYAFVDGVALLVALARGDVLARRHAWLTGLTGVAGIAASVVTLLWPGITAVTLLYIVSVWAITTGILQLAAAIEFRKEIDGEFWMILGALASIAFGVLLLVYPSAGLLSLVWIVGIWAIVFGISSLGLGYRLHKINNDINSISSGTQKASGVA